MLNIVEAKGSYLLWATAQIEDRLLKRFEHGFDLPGVEAFSSAFGWLSGQFRERRLKMSNTAQKAAMSAGVARVDMKFEVVVIPVSDVDRAKEFYGRLGWRLDATARG